MRPPSSLPSACIAASLMTRTGAPSAAAKSNPTQPVPRFHGSSITAPRSTGLGTPMVTASKVHPCGVRLHARDQLLRGEPIAGPELPLDGLTRHEQLDVRPADVHHENAQGMDRIAETTKVTMTHEGRWTKKCFVSSVSFVVGRGT